MFPPPPETPRYYFERTIFGSNDVIEETSTDRLRRFATGESVRGRGFSKPFDIEVLDGRIFISDTVSRKVAVLDFPRRRYYEIGRDGIGRLAKPLGIAADKGGRLYVVDGTARRVLVYDYDGNFIARIGGEDEFLRPTDVAVNDDGDRIYVVDNGGVASEEHKIHIFDGAGNRISSIGRRGKAAGEFNLPLMAEVGPDGSLYVVDTGNFRIQVFSPAGTFLHEFGKAGRFPGQFSHPKGIDIGPDGKIFVVDTSFANFQIFRNDGRVLLFIGQRSDAEGGPAKYLLPAGIAVDHNGRIFVVDQFYRKIDVYRPASLPAETPIGPPLEPAPSS